MTKIASPEHSLYEQAYKEICAEHEGEDKYLIKLEMMKEAIFDDRLKVKPSSSLLVY